MSKPNLGVTSGKCLRLIDKIAQGKMYKQAAAEEDTNVGYVSVAKDRFPLLFWGAKQQALESD